jgi:lipopolysaccharide transport system permease protein
MQTAEAIATHESPQHETIIEPSRGWLSIRWRELWEYRDLLLLLVHRDFVSRYKQTILGPLWFILQPLLTTAIFFVVFGRVAGIPTGGIPAPLFYLCGLLGWNYFSQNVTAAGATFVNNSQLFGKVWFPRLIVPIAVVVANLVSFALQMIPFIACAIYYRLQPETAAAVNPDWRILLAPLPLIHLGVLSLGVSLLISASTAKYRDLVHLTQYLVQLWMFASPIIYPLSRASDKYAWIIHLNPVSVPIESFRITLLGQGHVSQEDVLISVAITLLLFVTGLAAFQKVERTVVDSV